MLLRIVWGVILSLHIMVVQAAGFNQSTWDALLKKHVVSLQHGQVTQVDYAAMQQDKSRLSRYLQSTSAVSRGFYRLNDFFVFYYQALDVNHANIQTLKNMDIEFLDYDWRLNKKS